MALRFCACGARLRRDLTCGTPSCRRYRPSRRGLNFKAPVAPVLRRLRRKTAPAHAARARLRPVASGAEAWAVRRRALQLLSPLVGDVTFLDTAKRAEIAADEPSKTLAALAQACLIVKGLTLTTAPFSAEELVAAAFLIGLHYVGLAAGDGPRAARSRSMEAFGIAEHRLRRVECVLLMMIGSA
ncbi:MAG: hypothetical protein EOO77_17170 [Oxalobacteraceae bacterium]|nr:MAG: hypothetical protein EOO77_17170 [Oxalobacteraceae bacterium]